MLFVFVFPTRQINGTSKFITRLPLTSTKQSLAGIRFTYTVSLILTPNRITQESGREREIVTVIYSTVYFASGRGVPKIRMNVLHIQESGINSTYMVSEIHSWDLSLVRLSEHTGADIVRGNKMLCLSLNPGGLSAGTRQMAHVYSYYSITDNKEY